MYIGCAQFRISRTAVRSACGHSDGSPKGVLDQSCARTRRAISPSPPRNELVRPGSGLPGIALSTNAALALRPNVRVRGTSGENSLRREVLAVGQDLPLALARAARVARAPDLRPPLFVRGAVEYTARP